MSITVNTSGFGKIGRMTPTLLAHLSEATADAANAVQNFTKQQIAKGPPRTGRLRKTRKGKRRDRSSARGEYPKGDTGTLGRSIIARHQKGTLHAKVGSHLKYAAILESDELDRRHITRAAEEMRPFVFQLAQRAVQKSITKAEQ